MQDVIAEESKQPCKHTLCLHVSNQDNSALSTLGFLPGIQICLLIEVFTLPVVTTTFII